MRFMVYSNNMNSFFSDSMGEFESCNFMTEVFTIIRDNWINTPDYISYLSENEMEGETICIIDFEKMESTFIETQIETKVDIKIYD